VLLDGEDGGPEALRFRFDPCPAVPGHMHLTAQFQLLLGGSMRMPRGRMHLRSVAVHYTDHNVPYGPFSVGPGHDMLVLHAKRGGLITLTEPTFRSRIFLPGRLLTANADERDWQPNADGSGRHQQLLPASCGPEVLLIEVQPESRLDLATSQHGRYEVVIRGSVLTAGVVIGPGGLRWTARDAAAPPLVGGSDGALVAVLAFDADALEGGLDDESDPMVRAATDAMTRAI
jgi:hypothetical protein